ncbi:Rgp1-domain-containing protein [Bisporella sp. PMI_857]|nr:Rgp1-domain-containing protein [Bisporella sp. PMI_857]
MSSIRVFVQWTEQTVFAGEDIECQITFKNIATSPAPSRTSLHPSSANGLSPGLEKQRKGSPAPPRSNHALSPKATQLKKGHRTTLSLNSPIGLGIRSPQLASGSWNGAHPKPTREGTTHKRSVSIISIGAGDTVADSTQNSVASSETSRRPGRRHGRSASLQIVPRRNGVNGGPLTAPLSQRSSTQPSPRFGSPNASGSEVSLPQRPGLRQTATAPNTPEIGAGKKLGRLHSGSSAPAFYFPASSSPPSESLPVNKPNKREVGDSAHDNIRLPAPRVNDAAPVISEHTAPITRILSPSSNAGTPRSSGEFYSLSNNSTETLASEYLPHQSERLLSHTSHARRPSNLVPANHHRPPESLMMGYAQIHGSFTIDGSLISQTSFEEVKRKGAVGGQGGGVIGVESSKRNSGMLRGFGWGNIGESIGGLLGGGELSSIKDMRGIASSKSIPLLSTPQSILFVDLRLAPGESKVFKYTFKLPRGLPPSHRGKAIKIAYNLIIGTQRPGGAKEQQVKSVEVPFRVLGSVNAHGELLGHDLMSPYIILRDQAKVLAIGNQSDRIAGSLKALKLDTTGKRDDSTLNDFLSYVDELINWPRQNSSRGLLSPTEAPRSRRPSSIQEPSTAKEAIDMAILRSNTTTEYHQSANRFEIARSGQRVAVIMLARPAYRLGETITAAIDFTDAEIPCYAVHASLESSERVDNSIALRSEASILRVTRKIYSSHSESTLFARRIVFSPTIPTSATPEFITSGVSLDWRIRIEFVTPDLINTQNEGLERQRDLLEQVSRDDRGIVLGSAEMLECESFEIAVPLRVYGALAGGTEKDDGPSEGLVV